MIMGDLREALEACRGAGLRVGPDRVTCPACAETWWVPPVVHAGAAHARWLGRFLARHRDHVAAGPELAPRFTMLVEPAPTGGQVAALRARCPGAAVGSSPRWGVGWVSVTGGAEALADAIAAAVRDVEACGLRAVRVERDEPGGEPVLEAANLALLLRGLGAEVERIEVIRTLVAP